MAKSFSPGTTRSRKSDGPGENGDPATPLTATLTVTHSETHTIERSCMDVHQFNSSDEFPVEKHQKPDTKVYMLYNFIYMKFKNR